MIKLRYPDFSTPSQAEPLKRVQSYLYQIVDELNIALANVDGQGADARTQVISTASSDANSEKEAQATFSSIKSLIIKSADIVEAYYEVINKKLEGLYVAKSDFGTYVEQTGAEISANSYAISQNYTNVQQILSEIETDIKEIDVRANIKSGLLGYDDSGVPVYGLEIGQRTEVDGEEVFNKYAQFTADKLAFFDQNGNEVAYISDRKLYITEVEVTGSYKISGFVDTILADKSVVTKWVEGG